MARQRGPATTPGAPQAHGRPGYAPSPYGQPAHDGYDNYPAEPAQDGYNYPSYPPQQPEQPAPNGYGYAPPRQHTEYSAPQADPYANLPGGQDPRYADHGYAPRSLHEAPLRSNDAYAGGYAPESLAYDNAPPAQRGWQDQGEPQQPAYQDYRQPQPFDRAAMPRDSGRGIPSPEPEAYAHPSGLRGPQYDQWPNNRGGELDLGNFAPAALDPRQQGYDAAGGRTWPGQQQPEPLRFDQEIDQSEGKLQPYDQDAADDYEDEEEEAPPKRRGRGLLIAAALVGAIGLGGGLAYGYKMFFAAPPKSGTPVVKAPVQPSKTAPADPGGRKFANADSKVMERLPTDGNAGTDPAGDDTGTRRVTIIPVTRDGTLANGGAQPPAAAPLSASVPGMTLVGGGVQVPPIRPVDPPQAVPPVAQPPAPPSAMRPAAAPQVKPQVISRADTAATVDDQQAAEQTRRAPPVAPPPAAAPAPRAAPATSAIAAAAPPSDVVPKKASTAFVAVLASQKTRMEALSLYADLQQRFATILSDKAPDVVEVDLSARNLGTVYRLVVKPAGARNQALEVCNQLKAAGFQGCWVTGL